MSKSGGADDSKNDTVYFDTTDVDVYTQVKVENGDIYTYTSLMDTQQSVGNNSSGEQTVDGRFNHVVREKFEVLVQELKTEFPDEIVGIKELEAQVKKTVEKVLEKKTETVNRFFWQQEFSRAKRLKNVVEKHDNLYRLSVDMTTMCSKYAEIIITETFENDQEKTIQAIDVGGIAGGDKFLVR
jgi:hypothetical protein